MRSSASEYFEIPKFFVFGEKGIFSGSAAEKDLNYKIIPHCPKDGERVMRVYIWSGELCLDKTESSQMKEFPLTEEGHAEMLRWLEGEYLSRETVKTPAQRRAEYADRMREEYLDMDDYLTRGRK